MKYPISATITTKQYKSPVEHSETKGSSFKYNGQRHRHEECVLSVCSNTGAGISQPKGGSMPVLGIAYELRVVFTF